MGWTFRRRRAPDPDQELLSSTSVRHLKTMPGTDVVIGTLYTDPLAPPEEDPEAFYEATPEAAPRRLRVPPRPTEDAEAFQRLQQALLEALCPRRHQRTWMAVKRCRTWSDLKRVAGQWIPTTDGWELAIHLPDPSRVVVTWHDRRSQQRQAQLVRGVHW